MCQGEAIAAFHRRVLLGVEDLVDDNEALIEKRRTEDVRFDFLWLNFTWPLWLYTIVTALFGALVWFGLGVMRRHSRRKERREDRRN